MRRRCSRELEALGYVDGKTIAVEYRDAGAFNFLGRERPNRT
jgi:hypothetical protein